MREKSCDIDLLTRFATLLLFIVRTMMASCLKTVLCYWYKGYYSAL